MAYNENARVSLMQTEVTAQGVSKPSRKTCRFTQVSDHTRVMMAGIAVGTIKSIRLDHGMARVDITMLLRITRSITIPSRASFRTAKPTISPSIPRGISTSP